MAQFTLYRNLNRSTQRQVPYLLDVQAELLSDLATRVVVPFYAQSILKGNVLKTLTPLFRIGGKNWLMATPEMAGVSRKVLGPAIADLSSRRAEIIAALDLLITGI